MPKIIIDYSNTIFYKIVCKDPRITYKYVGHTTNYVQKKHYHKYHCATETTPKFNSEIYKIIRAYGGWNNWTMDIINTLHCNNQQEVKQKEQEYSAALNAPIVVQPLVTSVTAENATTENDIVQQTSNRFSCKLCSYVTYNKFNFDKHKTTLKHKNNYIQAQSECENSIIVYDNAKQQHVKMYECTICEYSTKKHCNYNKHLASKKHINKLHPTDVIVSPTVTHSCACGKTYKDPSGLWKHSKKCKPPSAPIAYCNVASNVSAPLPSPANAFVNNSQYTNGFANNQYANGFSTNNYPNGYSHNGIQSNGIQSNGVQPNGIQHNIGNNDLTSVIIDLLKQNQDIQKQLLEIAKEGKTVTNNNNNNNNTTTNNSFNLHVYLNETCKDAVNMVDFVNSLHLQLSDLEETGKLGYSNGMSRIFINGLKDMDACKRPIHCSDLKRETLYIKEDNVWEKDNEDRDRIKKAIRKIEQKNIQQIPIWIKAHPNCVISNNRENTPYLKMVMQSTGGINPNEESNMDKIITNIAREVVISKSAN
jgi:hypothetical protein